MRIDRSRPGQPQQALRRRPKAADTTPGWAQDLGRDGAGQWGTRWLHLLLLTVAWAVLACGGGGGGTGGGSEGQEVLGPPDAADYFPLAAGHIYVYVNAGGQEERTRVVGPAAGESGVWRVVRTGYSPGESFYRRSAGGIMALGSRDSDPVARAIGDFELFRMPARTGQSWLMYDTVLRGLVDVDGDSRLDVVAIRATARTEGYEAVDTPSGRFERALKVRVESVQRATLAADGRQVGNTVVSETWYVADVGPVRGVTRQLEPPALELASSRLTAYGVGARRSETTAPTIRSVTPQPGAFVRSGVVVLEFDEEMNPESAGSAPIVVIAPDGQPVQGSSRWDSSFRNLTFTPAEGSLQGQHEVRVSAGFTDLVGNPLAAAPRWTAVMDNVPPAVVSVTPSAGAAGVAVDARILVTLSEPVQAEAMLAGGLQLMLDGADSPLADTITGSGAQWTFTPAQPLWRNKRYQVRVSSFNSDASGNGLPFSQSFFDTERGRFSPERLPYDASPWSDSVAADVDGDGRLEFVHLTNDLRVLAVQAISGGGFGLRELLRNAPYPSSRLLVDDIDADGRPDILLFASSLAWMRQAADGRFVQQTLPGFDQSAAALTLRQPDGLRSLLAYVPAAGWMVWRQTAPGVFAAPQPMSLSVGAAELVAADMDGDGLPDLVSSAGLGGDRFRLSIDHLDANQTPTRSQLLEPFASASPPRVAVGDIDGDGLPDIVYTTPEPPFQASLWWSRQSPRGSFSAPVLVTNRAHRNLSLADVDGDGRLDIVTDGASSVALHLQLPSGGFAPIEAYAELFADGRLAVGDFDADGLLDLAAGTLLWRQVGTTAGNQATLLRFGILGRPARRAPTSSP